MTDNVSKWARRFFVAQCLLMINFLSYTAFLDFYKLGGGLRGAGIFLIDMFGAVGFFLLGYHAHTTMGRYSDKS
jgi:hypothetical protein